MDAVTLALAKAYANSQRLAYSEPSKTLAEFEIVDEENYGLPPFELVAGKKYAVTISAGSTKVTFVREGKVYSEPGVHLVWLGNISLFGGEEDNEDVFFVASGSVEGEMLSIICRKPELGRVNVSIATTETIHTIDPKYLPEGGFGYSELDKVLTINKDDIGTRFPFVGSEIDGGYRAVLISDSVMDLNEITEYTVCFDPEWAAAAEIPDRIVISEIEVVDYGDVKSINFNGVGVITSGSGFKHADGTVINGTFTSVQMDETGKIMAWFTDFKFAETVHTIDPKFIPSNGGFPRFNLKDLGFPNMVVNFKGNSTDYHFHSDDYPVVKEIYKALVKGPIIVDFTFAADNLEIEFSDILCAIPSDTHVTRVASAFFDNAGQHKLLIYIFRSTPNNLQIDSVFINLAGLEV